MWSDVEARTDREDLRWMRRLLRGYMDYHRSTEGFLGAYLHDPVALAEAIAPGLLRAEPVSVEIVARNGPARGLTLEGANRQTARGHVQVARDVRRLAFFRLFDRVWAGA
jgi:inosine-uridine nucleoside N-ribohydrolase